MHSPRPNPSIGQTKHFASVGAIELDLLRHATRFAYVLPETIADIVDHPALHYANRTPVYHVVGEPYRKKIYIHTRVRSLFPYPGPTFETLHIQAFPRSLSPSSR